MKKLVFAILSLFVLAGCSSSPQIAQLPSTAWDKHKESVESLRQWAAEGKIGIKTDDQYNPATFQWKQEQERYQLSLKGPLGQGSANISGNQYSATLEIPGEPLLEAASPEELLQLQLGWQIPVRDAQFWIRGIPSPNSDFDATFSGQKLAILKQQGWAITYSRYIESESLSLPGKVVMSRDALKLTIVIKKWRTNR